MLIHLHFSDETMGTLSQRATEAVGGLDLPWRFAPRGDYDPEHNPSGLISFGTAENALVTDQLKEFTDRNVTISHEDFLYRGSHAGGSRFPLALAAHLNEYLTPHSPITPDMIQCVGAATAMHDILAWGVADPGDGVLTSRPVYGRFELDFGNKSQVRVVYSDNKTEDAFQDNIVDKFEEALMRSKKAGIHVKMVLIVNPHNPLVLPET
ncbi:hypothetical protein NW766_006809 [Fusarium irregulare]|uniref:Aminotransferase class I/classII large domain-containing protein n=1 Tax=Fusarium irregulare TaxID=2494466 RepID=A0A9W8U9Q2_9HYPO|nr:hypothetical protein NW766_006809 [Fusarium irregulare]